MGRLDFGGRDGTADFPDEPSLDADVGAYDTGTDFALDTELQIADAVRSLQGMESIQPKVWETFDPSERLTALQQVEETLAAIQGRPSIGVHAESVDPDVAGAFDGERITINGEHLRGGMPVEELVDTIIHEGRHAFQQYAVEHPGFLTDAAVTRTWAENFATYLDPETYGQELYQTQPVEADAWSYAGRICGAVYSGR
jgi:hypothetical protein